MGATSTTAPSDSSYRTSFASAARNSLVPVAYRRLGALRQVSTLDHEAAFVLGNALGDHLAIDFGDHIEVRTRDGTVTMQSGTESPVPVTMLSDTVLLVSEFDFEGHVRPDQRSIQWQPSDRVWAIDATRSHTTYAAVHEPVEYMHHAMVNGHLAEIADRTSETTSVSTRGYPQWYDGFSERNFSGSGCVAIARDGRVAVAMGSREFFLLDTTRQTAQGAPLQMAFAKLPFVATDISFVDGNVAVMSGRTLHVLDSQAHEVWHADAGWDPTQPPIDGALGRAYLVGRGILAADQGKIVWTHPADQRSFATSLADGVVLFASGATLEALDRNGAVLEQVRASAGETFVTPPAVFSDGRAAIATSTGLYVSE